jgi:ubiquinone biosynthesis protein
MRRRVRLLVRLIGIQRILLRHGLDEIVAVTHLYRPLAWLLRPRLGVADVRSQPQGVRLRRALEELGPIFVKFGQALSTRRDLLPRPIADELAKLQDQVPPFPSDQALAMVEKAFRKPASEVFAEFSSEPLAAASIAQVHVARLVTGEEVVVKLLRPGVRERIEQDLEVLFALADLARRYWPEGRRLRPVEVVEEYQRTILAELNLLLEAANAAQLKRNFDGSPMLYVPTIYWDYCRGDVLTMERISGIPISDIDALKEAGANIKLLAENGVEIFFTQVFRHNFFHADMHPGNIFVDISNPRYPRYIAVDFGIVGTLTSRDQRYLAENFLAFFKRDYYRVAKLHVDSGWVPPDTRLDELEAGVRAVCEPIFNKPLREISFGVVLLRLFDTARRFNMEVQPQLVLLQKTLLNIEGLGRELYPDLDLWETAQPVLEDWVRQRSDPREGVKNLIQRWPEITGDLERLPDLVHRVVRNAADGKLTVKVSDAGLDELAQAVRASTRQNRQSIAGAAALVAGVIWIGLQTAPLWPGGLLAGIGLAVLLIPLLGKRP